MQGGAAGETPGGRQGEMRHSMWDGGVAGESGRGCWGTWGVRRGVSGVRFGRVWGCVYMGGMRECMGYGGCLGVWVGKGCPGGWQGGK